MQKVLDWLTGLESKKRKQLYFALGLVALLFGVLLSNTSSPKPEQAVESSGGSFTVSGEIFVHVVGEVSQPGLYELDYGSRVRDVVAAAGGFTSDAVESSVNLARLVYDGEQVVILAESQMATAESDGFISLNRATSSQLETLPGIGPALAGRILAYRDEIGSFASVDQLLEVTGIGSKLFEQLKVNLTL
ncbi:MAG: ComEA family DNA-binding protein [Aquiluna sp.]|nr:ComEA family DNA-binding protein [Aquiluna sp.]